jgi:hypothetical protein
VRLFEEGKAYLQRLTEEFDAYWLDFAFDGIF